MVPQRNSGRPKMMPFPPSNGRSRSPRKGQTADDYKKLVEQADVLLRCRLSDPQQRGAYTIQPTVDEITRIVSDGSGSVLLLGEAGSGKTHAVESALSKLQQEHGGGKLVILRAHGVAYSTDVECIRHLASQIRGGGIAEAMLPRNASSEHGMEFIRGVLRSSLTHARQMVVVLEKFEAFCCSKSRQTLLYNLFDIAEEAGVRLSIIGTSEKIDVTDHDSLEKRIKSRFSMHHLHTYLPRTIEELLPIVMEKFRLADDWGFPASFVSRFHTELESALRLRAKGWEADLAVGRPPAWFFWQCLPMVGLLQEMHGSSKAERLMTSARKTHEILVGSLCEDEHLVLLALQKIQHRQANPTLGLVLHELEKMPQQMLTARFSVDRYASAFEKLLQAKLVDLAGSPGSTLHGGSGALPRVHRQCRSCVTGIYEEFVKELKDQSRPQGKSNPVRRLPQVIQQWVQQQ